VSNPGAEDGTVGGWQASGTAAAAYGSSNMPTGPGLYGEGSRLFAFNAPNATLTQVVSVADLSPSFDGATVRLSFGGTFGANGTRADPAQISVQALDGAGAPLGLAQTVGPVTPEARRNATDGLICNGSIAPPVGTRSIQVAVASPGGADGTNTAFADELYVTTATIAFPTSGGSDNGCIVSTTIGPAPEPPAVKPPGAIPKLTSLVSMSSRATCRRTPARIRVKPTQRAKVRRLSITSRGRTTSLNPNRQRGFRSVAIEGRRTVVRLNVQLVDGRIRTGTITYRACR
jgi:hypothetical protein